MRMESVPGKIAIHKLWGPCRILGKIPVGGTLLVELVADDPYPGPVLEVAPEMLEEGQVEGHQ